MNKDFSNAAKEAFHQAINRYLKLAGVLRIQLHHRNIKDHNDEIIAIYVRRKYYFFVFDKVPHDINGFRIIIFITNF